MPALSRPSPRLWPLVALCLWVGGTACARGQSVFISPRVEADAAFAANRKWTAKASFQYGYGRTEEPYHALIGGVGGRYRMSQDAAVSVEAVAAKAEYANLENADIMLRLIETIEWTKASGFFFGFTFEQRRLRFHPANYSFNTSVFSAAAGYAHSWPLAGLSADFSCRAVVNMRSETTLAEFLQRVRLAASVRKAMSDRLALFLNLSYAYGGEYQIYIADRDGMLGLNFGLSVTLGKVE